MIANIRILKLKTIMTYIEFICDFQGFRFLNYDQLLHFAHRKKSLLFSFIGPNPSNLNNKELKNSELKFDRTLSSPVYAMT